MMQNRGWVVTSAVMGINLALGVLYTRSVIKKAIPSEWGWSDADKALPYSIACIVFALVMVSAGRLQAGSQKKAPPTGGARSIEEDG